MSRNRFQAILRMWHCADEGHKQCLFSMFTISAAPRHTLPNSEHAEQSLLAEDLRARMQPPDQKLLCFLRLMGNTESFQSVADCFGLSKSSLHRNMSHVTEALLLQSSAYINWPETDFSGSPSPRGFVKFLASLGAWMGHIFP